MTSTEHPGFRTESLALDADAATEIIHGTLEGVTAAETDEGITFRTTDGTLIAVVTGTHYEEPAVELHYRTEPASGTATRKARKLWRALESYAE